MVRIQIWIQNWNFSVVGPGSGINSSGMFQLCLPVEHVEGNLPGRGINPRQGQQQAGDVFAVRDHSVLDVLVQLVESEK
jgi:hypothetical protein